LINNSLFTAYNSIVTGIPCFLLSGMYGSIADKYGRKWVMVIPLLGLLCYIGCILIINIIEPVGSYEYIITFGSLLIGASGFYPIYIMGIFAYTADCTVIDPQYRKIAYSLTESCMFVPKIFGPVLGGILAFEYGYTTPLLLMSCCTIVTIFWIFCIPESLPLTALSRHAPLELKLKQTFNNMKVLFTCPARYGGRSPIPYVLGAFVLYYFAFCGNSEIYILYMKHKFEWDSNFIGYYDGLEGAIYVTSMIFIPKLVHYISNIDVPLVNWILIGFIFR
jgi:MFS family permease